MMTLIGIGAMVLLSAFLFLSSNTKPVSKPTSVKVKRVSKTKPKPKQKPKSSKPAKPTPKKQNVTKATTTKVVFDGSNADKSTHVQLGGKLVELPSGKRNKEKRRELRDQAAKQFEGGPQKPTKATREAVPEPMMPYEVIHIDSINKTFVVA